MVVRIANAFLSGTDSDYLAYEFHRILAEMIIKECTLLSSETGIKTIALSGGVYQNILLLKLTKEGLIKNGLNVLHHSLIPPNDGGIALGQAFYGIMSLNK